MNKLLRLICFILLTIPVFPLSLHTPIRLKMSSISSNIKSTPSSSFVQSSIGKTAKFLVSGTAGLVLITHAKTWKPLYYISFAVLNAILSKILKRTLKIPRPVGSKEGGFGMPSSHTQSLFYFFSILSTIFLSSHAGESIYTILVNILYNSNSIHIATWKAIAIVLLGSYSFIARYLLINIYIFLYTIHILF